MFFGSGCERGGAELPVDLPKLVGTGGTMEGRSQG